MALILVLLTTILLGAALLYILQRTSNDPLEVNIPLAFAQLLLKYIPGYTVPLRADYKAGVFVFDPIRVDGKFSLNDNDIAVFDQAVRSQGSPFLLVSKTTPLVIKLLADRRCPIKPIGAVNSRNIITFLRPDVDARSLQKHDLTYTATFGSKAGIRRKRGVEFVITIDVMSEGEKIVQMELWMLQFLPSSHEPRFKGETKENAIDGKTAFSIDMATDDPRLWAKSCKDYNPIHVSKLGARLFGFKSVIAHGNHVAALALQHNGLPKAAFTLELHFLRPMLLPAKFDVLKAKQHENAVLTIVSSERQRAHVQMVIKS